MNLSPIYVRCVQLLSYGNASWTRFTRKASSISPDWLQLAVCSAEQKAHSINVCLEITPANHVKWKSNLSNRP